MEPEVSSNKYTGNLRMLLCFEELSVKSWNEFVANYQHITLNPQRLLIILQNIDNGRQKVRVASSIADGIEFPFASFLV